MTGEFYPVFESLERLLQGHVAAFHSFDQGFQVAKRGLEIELDIKVVGVGAGRRRFF